MNQTSLALLATLPLCPLAPAQDATQLRAALVKMSRLDAVAFRTMEVSESAIARQVGALGQSDEVVKGRQCGGSRLVEVNHGDDEVLFTARGMLARSEDGDWKLRHGCLVDGARMPFVLDPARLFRALAALADDQLQVVQTETAQLHERDVTQYTVVLAGEVGRELALSGALPTPPGMGRMVMIGGIGGRGPGTPEIDYDLAVDVDPETNHVLRVRARAYQKSAMPGGVQFRVGVGGEEVEIGGADEEDEAEQGGELRIVRGLPKRHIGKSTSTVEYDISFDDHGTAAAIELSDAMKRLLGDG